MKSIFQKAFLFICLLTTLIPLTAQDLGLGILIAPQNSFYSYSNAYAPNQPLGVGLVTGISFEARARNNFYAAELQALYSFERHEFSVLDTLQLNSNINYVKLAIMNNFLSLNPEGIFRVIAGVGPQVAVLTQADYKNKETNIISDLKETTTKYDIGIAFQTGIQLSFSEATIKTGLRYDRGFIDITPEASSDKIKNNTIGLFFTIQANL